ncbi:MAG: hypothetical protein CVV25_12530 [Ignavibacteriae bacterium HGW-Ignavibacteriae-4]|jgi:methyl-accepting chemotaxis protein|nr:MAG: hypothetical protein CVV25_12530 [Ignavibacteriae bacterium HGW-Ignavibacteriae-4]
MEKKIETLTSLDGRKFLHELYKKLKYENELSGLMILIICWKVCVFEKNPSKFVKTDVTILHKLGAWKGTTLWIEEIVNRHFYSTINSFVYFGAAILLVLIGVRKFSDAISTELVIGSIIFEASMLLLIFVVMLFSPDEDLIIDENESEESILIQEIGEIGTDFATAVSKLEDVSLELKNFNNSQAELINKLAEATNNISKAVSPSDEFIYNIKQTNEQLSNLRTQIESLTESTRSIREKDIRFEIRRELENLLIDRVRDNDTTEKKD